MNARIAGHVTLLAVTTLCRFSGEPPDPRLVGGLLEVPLGECCKPYVANAPVAPIYADDPAHSGDWRPVVDVLGRAHPAGHVDDAYFTGESPPAVPRRPPSNYHYLRPAAGAVVSVQIADAWPGLGRIRFRVFDSRPDGRLTPLGRRQAERWLRSIYGDGTQIKELGEGGYSVAYRVCPPQASCVVAKVRKIPPAHTPGQLMANLQQAVTDLRRDLGIYVLADAIIGRGVLLDQHGARPPLARVARFTQPERFKLGIIEQELIGLPESATLVAELARLDDGQPGRKAAIAAVALAAAASPDGDVTVAALERFLDRFHKPSRFGPDVIKVAEWLAQCRSFDVVPDVHRLCAVARAAYRIPADFDARLAAFEQLYRDTAAEVIRFSRANFEEATGNASGDGLVREMGLDFNHGRNAGWEPASQLFVLFDY